jgi:hypothetical protein
MSSVRKKIPILPLMPPFSRAAFRPLGVLFLLALCAAAPVLAGDQGDETSAHQFDLRSDLVGRVDFQGGLIFQSAGSRLPLLTTEFVSLTDARRRRGADPFHATVVDGAENGQRGFSSRADDDQDGRTDEDRLDGMDNDGDGRIDEDFAAIGDAMVAVHLQQRGSDQAGAQVEYYHWSTACLRSVVFLNVRGGDEVRTRGTYRIQTSGSPWLETEAMPLRHDMAGRPEAEDRTVFICRVSPDGMSPATDPCGPGSGLWLGVMILDDESTSRFRVEEDRLDLPLGESPVPMVVCVADSWLQLNRSLGEARSVYEGVVDPVDNRHARWIPSPSCPVCRSAEPYVFSLEDNPDGGLKLATKVHPGQCGLLDPDFFQVGDHSLGAPQEIRWIPTDGPAVVVSWPCLTPESLRDDARLAREPLDALADLLGHEAGGRLEFIFDAPDDALAGGLDTLTDLPAEVAARYLDGRTLKVSLTPARIEEPEASPTPGAGGAVSVEEVARGYAEDRERILKSGQYHPSLSPDLLMGWPNPFNDIISIRFTVPRTMKEAFIWKSQDKQPLEIDLEGDVPWSGGQPGVTVKIYSINGQELVTIHSGTESPGEYTVQWNGADAFGRKVASGTYFCKLQMDDWSVTRRLVFIR